MTRDSTENDLERYLARCSTQAQCANRRWSRRTWVLVGCAALALVALNCATVINSPFQSVAINSSPRRAKVVIRRWNNGGPVVYTGVTPARCRLPRAAEYDVEISLPGYESQNVQIFRTPSAPVAGNIFCGGCLGGGIDLASGSAYDLRPNAIDVDLSNPGGSGDSDAE